MSINKDKEREIDPEDIRINPDYEKLVPPMSPSEFESLTESIRTNEQFFPITTNQHGIILDGHNRFKACKSLGIEPKVYVKYFKDELEEKNFIYECNLERRQLTKFQRIKMAEGMRALEAEQARRRQLSSLRRGNQAPSPQNNVDGDGGRVSERMAKKVGVSKAIYEYGIYLLKYASPEMLKRVEAGEIAISAAAAEVRDLRMQPFDLPFKGETVTLSPSAIMICGDFREITPEQMKPETLDLVIVEKTLSGNENLLCKDIGKFASKFLKEGGHLAIDIYHSDIANIIQAIAQERTRLRFRWPVIVRARNPYWCSSNVQSETKIYGIFVKGYENRKKEQLIDFIDTTSSDGRTLLSFDIIPFVAGPLIKQLTSENEVVCSLMYLGCSVAQKTLSLNRKFIGIQQEQKSFKRECANIQSGLSQNAATKLTDKSTI